MEMCSPQGDQALCSDGIPPCEAGELCDEGEDECVPETFTSSSTTTAMPETTVTAPVPKTGQTIAYVAGDDGDWEMGVFLPSPRFTDNSNGTVTDKLTGLIWLKDANCALFRAPENWSDAIVDSNGLTSGSCGLTDDSIFGDWRLPNIREMESLIDFSQFDPAIPSEHPFENVQSDGYWSSTTYADSSSAAWSIDINDSQVNYSSKSDNFYVWPVRRP
jgi:hypothetical protein